MNEFQLIKKYLSALTYKNDGSLKLSDDIFFDKKTKTAISLDTFVEGIHFINSKDPKYFLKKCLRSSLSDLLCKGVVPKKYFLSFSINKNLVSKKWMKAIKNILNQEQHKYKISLAGGDTVYSSKFIITIVIFGFFKDKPILRSGANYNDDIYVTGNIGDSFLGLNVLKKKYNFGKFNKFFIKQYYEPNLQYKLSPYLSTFASSAIDISDGFVQDLKHLCTNSNCGAIINLNLLPLSSSIKNLLKLKKIKLKNIFSNGDDYQILFTSRKENRRKIIALSKKIATKISLIGQIKKNKKIDLRYNGKKLLVKAKKMGYMHNF